LEKKKTDRDGMFPIDSRPRHISLLKAFFHHIFFFKYQLVIFLLTFFFFFQKKKKKKIKLINPKLIDIEKKQELVHSNFYKVEGFLGELEILDCD